MPVFINRIPVMSEYEEELLEAALNAAEDESPADDAVEM